MVEKFEIHTEAERFIHNDLSNCAWGFRKAMHKKILSGETDNVYFDMMGSLVFIAFAIEAKVNFVGWKALKGGWPERAGLREKIDLLTEVLPLELDWGERPLQTISQLKRFRDTIAHGKPETVNEKTIENVEPDIWDALKGQWEASVNPENVDRCFEDMGDLWRILLEGAGIDKADTLTHGAQKLRAAIK